MSNPLDRIDIRLVARKSLQALSGAHVPDLAGRVTATGNEKVGVVGRKRDAHDVGSVVVVRVDFGASLDVPKNGSHISGRRNDLLIVDKAARGKVAVVRHELLGRLCRAVFSLEVVDRAHVVETTAGYHVARGSISTGHDPGRLERDGSDFVGSPGVPDDQFAVLRRADQVSLVGSPVHGVDLAQMALEGASDFEADKRQGFHVAGNVANW